MSTAAVDRGDIVEPVAVEPVAVEPEVKGPVEPEVKEPVEPGAKAEPEAKERDDAGRFIPKGRFDEAVGKERSARENAERQLAELQAQLKQNQRQVDTGAIEQEIQTLEKSYTKLILQGDEDQAAAVMGQIRLKERTVAIQEATHLSAQAKDQAREEVRVDAAIERVEELYPELRENDPAYDQEIVDLVLAAQSANINDKRMPPSLALVKAAEAVMKLRGGKPSDDEGDKKGLRQAEKSGGDRKADQVAKNIEAAKRQPASMKDAGIDSDKAGVNGPVDVTKLSREEFAALPEATKSKLRGDLV